MMSDAKYSLSSQIRRAAVDALVLELSTILVHLYHPHSGRLAESMFQLLSDKLFGAVTLLVVGHEQEALVREFVGNICVRIAQKLVVDISDEETIIGMTNILGIINCENLRRKGHMEYLWPDDIFHSMPADEGYSQLTESGKILAQQFLLQQYDGKTIQ